MGCRLGIFTIALLVSSTAEGVNEVDRCAHTLHVTTNRLTGASYRKNDPLSPFQEVIMFRFLLFKHAVYILIHFNLFNLKIKKSVVYKFLWMFWSVCDGENKQIANGHALYCRRDIHCISATSLFIWQQCCHCLNQPSYGPVHTIRKYDDRSSDFFRLIAASRNWIGY